MVRDQGGGQAEITDEQREGIRARLKQFREERGWSARELAGRAEIKITTVVRWGGDRNDVPSTGNLLRLASPKVQLNPRWLLLGEPDQPHLLGGAVVSRKDLGAMLRDYLVGELATLGGWQPDAVRRWLPDGEELLRGLIRLNYQRSAWSVHLESKFERPFTAADLPTTTLAGVPDIGPLARLLEGPAREARAKKRSKKSPKKRRG